MCLKNHPERIKMAYSKTKGKRDLCGEFIVFGDKIERFVVLMELTVSIAQRETSSRLPNSVLQLPCNAQMTLMVFDT